MPEHQNHGIGYSVMKQLEQAAAASGRHICLRVYKTNPRASTSYEDLGFRIVGDDANKWQMRMGPHLMVGEMPNASATMPIYREGDVAYRRAYPWTPYHHALLKHLEQAGFDACPRVVGEGITDDGREIISWVEGQLCDPLWPEMEQTLWTVGSLLAQQHAALCTFEPPADAVWRPWGLHDKGGDVFSHCNVAPWSVRWRAPDSLSFVGWEYSGPTNSLNEIALTGWHCCHLHDDDGAEQEGLPEAGTRIRWLKAMLDGYGLPSRQRAGLVDRAIEFAIHDTAAFARERKVTQQSTDPEPMWLMAWQIRAADWMMKHRSQIEAGIGATAAA